MDPQAIASNFLAWWQQPFKEEMSATNWFLFAGLILCIIWLWSRVLKEAGHFIGD